MRLYRYLLFITILGGHSIVEAQPSASYIRQMERSWIKDSIQQNTQHIYNKVLRIRDLGNDSVSAIYLKRAINYFKQVNLQNDTLVGRSHVLLGLALRDIDVRASIVELTLGLSYYKKYYPAVNYRVHATYFNIADKYFADQYLEEAQLYCDSSISFQVGETRAKNWPRVMDLKARIYGYLGDLEKSQWYVKCSKPYIEKYWPDDINYYTVTQAGIYRDLNLAERALDSLRKIPDQSDLVFFKYSQIAQSFINQEQYDSALLYLDRQLGEHNNSTNERNWIYANMGIAQEKKGEFDHALATYHQVQLDQSDGIDSLIHLSNYSLILAKVVGCDSALQIDRQLMPEFLTNDRIKPMDAASFFANYLQKVDQAWQDSQDPNLLSEAIIISGDIADRLQILRMRSLSVFSRQHFSGNVKSFYDTAIKICLRYFDQVGEKEYLELALQYMEATKSLVLIEEFAQKRSENNQRLKYRIKFEELEAQMDADTNLDARISLSDSIFYWLQREEREQFSDSMEYSVLIPEFSEFESRPGVMYLNYFQHLDSSLSIIGIGNNQSYFKYLPGNNWYHQVQSKLEAIRDYSVTYRDRDDQELLHQLLPGELADFPEKLVVVPDGILSYFPLGALKINQDDFLTQHYDVSYSFSLAMSDLVAEYPMIEGSPIIFAPTFEGEVYLSSRDASSQGNVLGPLKFNRTEATSILGILNDGQLFLQGDATATNFFQYCHSAPIIHVATHAVASPENDQKAQILFSQASEPGSVFLSDIYNQKIPTNMVVMSACETALGKYAQGEGVMSFARAFSSAGSKSVLASLWAVNDESTAKIMVHFYKYLKKGYQKDAALRKAQQKYLAEAAPQDRHPYYWAGFIVMGDTSALYRNLSIYLWGFLVVIAGFVIFYFWRRRKSVDL